MRYDCSQETYQNIGGVGNEWRQPRTWRRDQGVDEAFQRSEAALCTTVRLQKWDAATSLRTLDTLPCFGIGLFYQQHSNVRQATATSGNVNHSHKSVFRISTESQGMICDDSKLLATLSLNV